VSLRLLLGRWEDEEWEGLAGLGLAELAGMVGRLAAAEAETAGRILAHVGGCRVGDGEGILLRGRAGADIFREILRSGRAYWIDPHGVALRPGESWRAEATWEGDEEGWQRPGFRVVRHRAEGRWGIVATAPAYYIDGGEGRAGELETDIGDALLSGWLAAPALSPEEARMLREKIEVSGSSLPTPEHYEIEEIFGVRPRGVLRLRRADVAGRGASGAVGGGGIDLHECDFAELAFNYSGRRARHGDEDDMIQYRVGGLVYRIPRDHEREMALFDQLTGLGLRPLESIVGPGEVVERYLTGMVFPGDLVEIERRWLEFLAAGLEGLKRVGWAVDIDEAFGVQVLDSEGWRLQAGEQAGAWWTVRCEVDTSLGVIDLAPALARDAVVAGDWKGLEGGAGEEVLVEWEGGHRVRLARSHYEEARRLFTSISAEKNAVGEEVVSGVEGAGGGAPRLHRLDMARALAEVDGLMLAGGRLDELAERLETFCGIAEVKLPESFLAELRPYQQQGFRWLQFLSEFGLAGILADDMGLGKTVQTLCHLAAEHSGGRAEGLASLIVAPTSLVPNWEAEVRKFVPGFRVLALAGARRERLYEHIEGVDLVLTSYAVLLRDVELLRERAWHLVVIDEAQQIKNPRSSLSRAVCGLRSRHRLALTGTPVENHLGELWSLFRFLMPGFLGSNEAFRRVYRHPIEEYGDEAKRAALARKIAPVVLRRTKEAVAKDLPSKTEIVHRVPLGRAQAELYNRVLERVGGEARASFGVAGGGLRIIEVLLQLRQVCCHPELLASGAGGEVDAGSSKLKHLEGLLASLLAEKRRVLVFSQFSSFLTILSERLERRGWGHEMLTGSTEDRAGPVERFQASRSDIFLISLKAGGTGLNLTKADVVIHYDPWWNPAAEAQATDRAYRIGQENPVFVYKLIAAETIEERILEMQDKKRSLLAGLMGERTNRFELTARELDVLLTPVGSLGAALEEGV